MALADPMRSRCPARPPPGDWFAVILAPRLRWSVGRFEDVLSIRQLVIVALSGILREVLDELPRLAG